MTLPKWISSSDLGILADGSYFEKQLEASNAAGPVVYDLISGSLPAGVSLTQSGKLHGVPTISQTAGAEINANYTFVVRARNGAGRVADRTFSLLVSGVQAPTIVTQTYDLGVRYDGDYFKYQLLASDSNPVSTLSWRFVRGRLPLGITLSSGGLLEGFFYQNKVNEAAFSNLGWDKLSWDKYMFDFAQREYDTNYEFTVELTDGINYSRQNYIVKVVAKDLLTTDRTIYSADETILSVDHTNKHLPFITTMPQILPEIRPEAARQSTNFAYKFDAVDFDGDEIYYEITSPDRRGFDQDGVIGFDTDDFDSSDYPMPPYIGLDNHTGWYTGHLIPQLEHSVDYEFLIYARKAYDQTLQGYKSRFVVRVLGQVDENVTWITGNDLGSIDNGTMSQLRVEAVNSSGKPLEYYIKGNGGRTPQGVILLKTGMLSGRVSFEHFKIDNGRTTFDNRATAIDRIYKFTVRAQTANKSAYSEKTFKLRVNIANEKPFENLYLKGFPNEDQRYLFKEIMDRQDLFPDPLIYRLNDPLYGKAKDLRFLFLPGINPSSLSAYIQALSRNHYNKTLLFGNLKTAVSLDSNYNIQYEVVYLDVVDDLEGRDPVTGRPKAAAQTIDLSKSKNHYTNDGTEYTEITPNGLDNMRIRVEGFLGYANKNTLPPWMTCPQPDYDNPGQYTTPLGYTRAVILAYTVPGASKLIAYRLKNANFSFNRIPFKTDRYLLDSYLTDNYDLELDRYIPGVETTVDQTPSIVERYRSVGSVDYAVTAAYNDIQGVSVYTVMSSGAIDGSMLFQEGETLIFYQQDKFPASVTGWLDHILTGYSNKRSAVFRINIVNSRINLTVAHQTAPGDIVTVVKGATNAGKELFFEPQPKRGPVPQWRPLTQTLLDDQSGGVDKLTKPHKETTFDQRGTRFFSYRDHYSDIDSSAKYIKFPKDGVFT